MFYCYLDCICIIITIFILSYVACAFDICLSKYVLTYLLTYLGHSKQCFVWCNVMISKLLLQNVCYNTDLTCCYRCSSSIHGTDLWVQSSSASALVWYRTKATMSWIYWLSSSTLQWLCSTVPLAARYTRVVKCTGTPVSSDRFLPRSVSFVLLVLMMVLLLLMMMSSCIRPKLIINKKYVLRNMVSAP